MFLSALVLLFLTACDDSGGAAGGGQEGKYAWVLIDQADKEEDLKGLTGSSSSPNVTSLQLDNKPGDFGISWVYTGETDESKNIKERRIMVRPMHIQRAAPGYKPRRQGHA